MVLAEDIDYIGINLWPKSHRGITSEQAQKVLESVPHGKRVMVDVSPESSMLRSMSSAFDYFQLHFPAEDGAKLIPEWAEVVGADKLWLAPRLAENTSFPEELLTLADTFLIDAASKEAFGGTGKTADWSKFNALKNQYPDKTFILAGGLNPENITQAIAESTSSFVDINSGVESAPGKKDGALLKRLLDEIKR